MFIRKLFHVFFLSETPEGASGGGTSAATVQPGTESGQGGQQQGDGSDNFWSLFPNVPEEHRAILQPHLRNMQGEITRLQQAQAQSPVQGYEPQQLQGLISFDQRFQQNPMAVWSDMTEMLQREGIIHESLDLESLRAIASGQDVEEGEEPESDVDTSQLDPAVQALITRLEGRIDQLEGGIQEEKTTRQTQMQDRLLQTQMERMREVLTKAGYSKEDLTDDILTSAIIAHKGQISAATKSLQDLRTSVLKGFTNQREQTQDLRVRNGGPQTPPRDTVRERDKNDPFARARPAAKSRLTRANRDQDPALS